MKQPSSDHPITIEPGSQPVSVSFKGQVVARTERALHLKEAALPVVIYVPREDVDMRFFTRSGHTTYCPYKGHANYFHVAHADGGVENAVWTYESPYPAVQAITGHLAFYPQHFEFKVGGE